MVSCFFFLHFCSLIFLFAASLSNGEDVHYGACSVLYSCGKLQNIGYPFWGGDRPEYCGMSEFKLSCKADLNTTMNVLSSNSSGYAGVRVLDISTSSHTMVVSPDKLFDRCYLQDSSKTFLSSLKPDPTFRKIHLFYGCNNNTCNSKNQFKSLPCNFNGANSSVYYFGHSSDISRISKSCSCQNNISFPVNDRVFDELISMKSESLMSILTKWPNIRMEYMANFSACSKCEKSGGRCGSLDDSSSDQFVCYCRDGNHSVACLGTANKMKILLGLGIGGGFFVLVAIITICCIWKLKHGHSNIVTRSTFDSSASDLEKASRYFGMPLFSYSELVAATNSFDQSSVLGDGGFGIVYYGKLKDGREVAVKRLYEKSYRRVKQFMNEVEILTRLRHQNLVSLYGCTSPKCRELLLVYEYVKNGTVADHLHGENSKSGLLPWPVRLRIAIETATALSYLHASDIIHRDVKTNNILLDSNFCVKVADFGLSRLFPTDVTHVSTAPQGTPGYLDPEYHLCHKLNDKSDVYSFGVVLIELISSLPPINMDRHKLEINLSNYAITRIRRCAYDELVDPQLGFALDFKVRRMTISVAELAFQCLQHDKDFRPSMDEVLENLKRIQSVDYEALQAEEIAKSGGEEMVKMLRSMPPPPSPSEDDHAQLLSNHQLYMPSPISVVDKWVSRSTASNSSK